MGFFFMIVFFVVSLAIVGLVLLQEGKGGGLTGMSTGMDGVMGAKNPLRRMTAYLFTFFILMCLGINWYFHKHEDSGSVLPTGIELPDMGDSDGPLRPETAAQAVANAVEAATAAPATEPTTPVAAPAVEPTAPAAEPTAPVAAPAAEPVAAPVAEQAAPGVESAAPAAAEQPAAPAVEAAAETPASNQ